MISRTWECQLTSRTQVLLDCTFIDTCCGSEGWKDMGNVTERSSTWTTRPSNDHTYANTISYIGMRFTAGNIHEYVRRHRRNKCIVLQLSLQD